MNWFDKISPHWTKIGLKKKLAKVLSYFGKILLMLMGKYSFAVIGQILNKPLVKIHYPIELVLQVFT